MPKFVVDLKNLDDNIQKVERVFNTMKTDLNNSDLVIASHDLDRELQSLKDFKKNLKQLFSKDIEQKTSTQEACNDQIPLNDPNRTFANPNPKDEYGNVFFPSPFEYDYVEIIYSNYELLEQVRLLGYAGFAITFPVRYYFANLENKQITPTTLKILENLEEFTGKDVGREILRVLRETIRKIDEACAKQLSSANPDKWDIKNTINDIFGTIDNEREQLSEWRELSKNYFVPSAIIRPKEENELLLKNLQKNLKILNEQKEKGTIRQESITNTEQLIEKLKKQVAKKLKNERLESQVSAKKEMPRAPIPIPNLDPCEPNPPKREDKENKSLENKIEAWKRRHSLACIVKDIKDCYIPPNLDFCQIIFKDPSINTFLLKLQLLKAPGTSQIFDKITESIEEQLGVKELREASEKINNLEILVADEAELLSYYNQKIDSFDSKLLNNLYPKLNGKKAAISLYNERISSGQLDEEQIANFNTKIAYAEQQIQVIETEIRTLTIERSQITARLEKLKANKEINEAELESLKTTYETRIQDLQFSQQQAELIRRGENLQAVFNAATEERLSDPQLFDAVVQAVDTIMPFDNLCAMFFQNTLPTIRFELPENFFESPQLKNPFEGLYEAWSKIITEFLIDVALGFIDSLMASLCNLVDSAIANLTDLGSNGPNYEKFKNDLINNGYNAIAPLLEGDYSSIVELGVDKFNTKLELGFKNPLTTRLEKPRDELCDDTSDVTPPIQPISVDISTNASGVLDFFFGNDRANPLAEWNISGDKKSFTYQPPPSLFDFSQIDQFINNSVNEFLNPELGTGNFGLQALIESFVDKRAPEASEASNPCETTGPLEETDFAVAASEVSCLMRNAASLLTPNQMLEMLTGNPSEDTTDIISNLARICAPTITGRMGNSPSFLMSMMREAGTVSGAADFLNSIKDLIDRNDFLPTTTSVSCERYDNTRQMIQGLMAETIPDSLAKQILDKIEEKRIDNFNHILNTFASANTGKTITKPQDAIQFYLEIVNKLVEAKESGRDPQSLEELGFTEPQQEQNRDIQSVLSAQDDFYKSQNPTNNTMLELVNESMLRPFRRTFKNDISSYINVMSGLKEVVKEEELEKEVEGNNILSLEYLSSIFGESMPVLKIPVDVTVVLGNPTLTLAAKSEINSIDSYKEEINNRIRQAIPGKFNFFGESGLIKELEEKYKNSSTLNNNDKVQVADSTKNYLKDLKEEISELNTTFQFANIQNLVNLVYKRTKYADFNFPYEDVGLTDSYYTNLGSSLDLIDKRQSIFPEIILKAGTNPNDEDDAGNFTYLGDPDQPQEQLDDATFPSQEELSGPPFKYHNPFGEDLCFLFSERNRSICHPYLLEISIRALLAICKYVKRTLPDGDTIEKWVIPRNMSAAPGITVRFQNIIHLIQQDVSGEIAIGRNKSVNFYNSFDLLDVIEYEYDLTNVKSPFYNPNIDQVLIDTNNYNSKFQKTNLIPLIPKDSAQDGRPLNEQDIYQFCSQILDDCAVKQTYINSYYKNIYDRIKDYFDEVKRRLEGKTKDVFKVVPESDKEKIKIEKIPSWILPFEKSMGQNTIKTNRVLIDDVNNENPILTINQNTFLPAIGDHYYISNGFTEDKYRTPFLTKEDSPALVSYVTTSVNEVGEKFIENSLNIPTNTTINISNDYFKIEIKGQHGKSSGNPFLQNGNLFNPQNNTNPQQNPTQQLIQTQFCGDDIVTDITTKVVVDSGVTAFPPTPQPTVRERCYTDIIQDPSADLDIANNLPDRSNLKDLLKDSLPRWVLYYEEQNNSMELGLNTSGISFSPTGKKYDFYHNTIFQYDQNSIESSLVEKITNKYNQFLSKTNAFYKFFDEKTTRDLEKTINNAIPEENNTAITNLGNLFPGANNLGSRALESFDNSIDIDMSSLYKRLVEDNFYKFVDSFKNNRLLNEYRPEDNNLLEIREEDKISKKLLEMVPLTRDPTDFERENELDPNIIDFENIKKEFKKLYSLEDSDELTKEQAIGRAASNSKTSKSAKNIFLMTLIRLCVVEHITKSIFLYDEIKFSKQCLNFSFVIKDVANFVLQEATRFGAGGLMHRQANNLYQIKVAEGKIEDSPVEKQKFKTWNEEYSYDGKESSPRLQALVKLELDKMLDKGSKILNCGSRGKDSASIINSLIEDLNVYDAPSLKAKNDKFFPLLPSFSIKNENFYFERYVKFGRLNPNLNSLFPDLVFKIKNKNIPNNLIENSVFNIKNFHEIIKYLTPSQREKFFLCEDKGSSIFIDPPKAGLRLMLNIESKNIQEIPENIHEFNNSVLDSQKINKIKSYCVYSSRFLTGFDTFTEPRPGEEGWQPPPWTSEQQEECYGRFGMSCEEAVSERLIEDRRGEESFREQETFSPEENQSLQGYEEELYKLNNLIVSEQEEELNLTFLTVSQDSAESTFDLTYLRRLRERLSGNRDTVVMFKYCLVLEEMLQLLLVNCNLVHHDQNGRFLFESSKSYICDMTKRLKDFGDKRKIGSNLANMQQQQKEREDNTGNPLGPALEALKFYYRTPIQILKGQATLVDPNIAIADKIVAAGAMAGSLVGQKIDIPYSLASLALLPAPLFNGIAPPIPPLTAYNMAMPVGPIFLALEPLLKDLPYYQNQAPVDENTTDANSSNPFFCELLPEENDD